MPARGTVAADGEGLGLGVGLGVGLGLGLGLGAGLGPTAFSCARTTPAGCASLWTLM